MTKRSIILLLSPLLFLNACSHDEQPTADERKTIVIHSMTDASTINPVNARGELANILSMYLYQPLIAIDYKSNETVPVLAESMPTTKLNDDGGMTVSYQIKPQAQFDNGQAIRAGDIAFSLKINLCPFVNNGGGPSYYSYVKSIDFESDTSLQFSITFKDQTIANEMRSGDYYIIPAQTFDSLNVLANYSIQDLQEGNFESDSTLKHFAESFNAMASRVDVKYATGSGPYTVISWQAGERIIIEQKEDWWGHQFDGQSSYFTVNAPQIQYEIINDKITALAAIKAGKIDFMKSIDAKDLTDLDQRENLETASALRFGYQYIGFNLNDPLLQEKGIRKAIELVLPREELVNNLFNGEVKENKLPLPLQSADLRNESIEFPVQDLDKSNQLLSELGWEDLDQNGIREKDGVELQLSYTYNSGNEQRKTVGLVLQQELKKVGIGLEIISLEWRTFLTALKEGIHQIFMSGSSASPLPPDFSGNFHSENANGGRNYANYNNPQIDSLIEQINTELDASIRTKLIHDFQEIVADDVPYLFLFTKNENIAYSSDLKDVSIYSFRPHYWAPEMH